MQQRPALLPLALLPILSTVSLWACIPDASSQAAPSGDAQAANADSTETLDAPTQLPDTLPDRPPDPQVPQTALDSAQRHLLNSWYAKVLPQKADESFGALVQRSAMVQLGMPYLDPPQVAEAEVLKIDLKTFQCVSFVESAMALSRCIWQNSPTALCFHEEVQQFRYRDGLIDGYASRLHYFVDWLDDNARRQRLQPLTASLGGNSVLKVINFITQHPGKFPSLVDPSIHTRLMQTERELTERGAVVLERSHINNAQQGLQNGDLVAIVTHQEGLFVSHAGFISRPRKSDPPRLLHASSYHQRVVLTPGDINTYIRRNPKRRGLMVYRPEPPGPQSRQTRTALP